MFIIDIFLNKKIDISILFKRIIILLKYTMTKFDIIAWNMNGIRSYIKKHDLNKFLEREKPHVFCVGETKLSCPDMLIKQSLKENVKGYRYRYFSTCIAKKGYSGTCIWSKKKPLNILHGINNEKHDKEGRVITLEFDNFYLTHVYTPNSGQALQRLNYRVKQWDPSFWGFIENLEKKKPVVVCGDLNCARYEIDIHSPKTNLKSAGFTLQERNSFNKWIEKLKLIDTFRHLNPDVKDAYTYWTYMRQARKKNKGWRIDYFLISQDLKDKLKKSTILRNEMGSDHAPIKLKIDV